jgi:hypothetical protein
MTGNLSSPIRPSGVQLTVTNTWSNALNVDNLALWGPAFAYPLSPYSNVSTPQINSNAGTGNMAFQAKAMLLNQTNSGGVNRFGLWSAMEYSYYTLSYFTGAATGVDIGKDVLHFTASLQGLGKPVFVTINVLLMDIG